MYRQPFGDAFLLTFGSAAESRHMLIDCGVLGPTSKNWAQDIARDIQYVTAGHLDAIVATHMHWDHVSGFCDEKTTFSQLAVDEVWLPWLENPNDPVAASHRELRSLQLDSVRHAQGILARTSDATLSRTAAKLRGVLAFYGPLGGTEGMDAASTALLGLSAAPRFCEQGMVVTPEQIPDLRIYVLGPSRDESVLDFDAYGSQRGFYEAVRVRVGAKEKVEATTDETQPFEARQLLTIEKNSENLRLASVAESYVAPAQSWRRIDQQWLLHAEEIANRLQDTINNLSLALAFELVSSGEVLLFPADAQSSSWRGWRALSWTLQDGSAVKQVTMKDLLARTVFYKVANHGSLNAFDGKSVEDMRHPDLAAGITADTAFARKLEIDPPAPFVYSRLLDKTQGRLLRPEADRITSTERGMSPAARSLARRARVTPLYIDYLLDG